MVQFCYLILDWGIGTVSCHLLLCMTRMNMDWHLANFFKLKIILWLRKSPRIIMVCTSWWNWLDSCIFDSSQFYKSSILCMGKDTKWWLQHRSDLKRIHETCFFCCCCCFLHLNLCTGHRKLCSLDYHVRRVRIFPDTI